MTNADLIGYWKITKMDVWDAAYVDLVVPGFIEFEMEGDHLMGQFQFGTVSGGLDCRVRDVSGESYVEWSWEGRSDTPVAAAAGRILKTESLSAGFSFTAATIQPSKPRDRSVLEIATRGGDPPGAFPCLGRRCREMLRRARE